MKNTKTNEATNANSAVEKEIATHKKTISTLIDAEHDAPMEQLALIASIYRTAGNGFHNARYWAENFQVQADRQLQNVPAHVLAMMAEATQDDRPDSDKKVTQQVNKAEYYWTRAIAAEELFNDLFKRLWSRADQDEKTELTRFMEFARLPEKLDDKGHAAHRAAKDREFHERRQKQEQASRQAAAMDMAARFQR